MSSIPDIYDPWGPVARAQGMIVMPEGTITDNGAGGVTFGSTLIVMAGGGNNNWIRVAAGSHTLGQWDALCVDVPPTNAPRGTYAAYVDAYSGSPAGDEKYPHRDRLVLGVRIGAGRIAWRYPALERAANPVVTNPWTDSGWQRLGIEIAYEGGHSNYPAPWGGAGWVAIRRLPSGLVVGRGLIQSGSGAVFTLPVGFRPSSVPEGYIIMTANLSGSNESFRLDTVGANAWKMMNSPGWGWGSLAGLAILAEQ